jgi:hypothetical protein
MFWRRRGTLPAANVETDWIERAGWRAWGAPSNHIAGEASYLPALRALVGSVCDDGYCIFTPVDFIREPGNRHDRNAFRAEVGGRHIGYLRREFAAQLAPELDRARCARFGVCGVIRGGSTTAPNLGVHVWLGRRVTPGPIIEIDNDPWRVPWPPNGWEVATFR